jgi:hypothetical protein
MFGRAALIQRCQVHKRRNVLEHLPERQRPWVRAILNRAYHGADVTTARRLLQDLARRLEDSYPSAADSVREGLDETLTVLGIGISERLRHSLATTNAIIAVKRHARPALRSAWAASRLSTAYALAMRVAGFRHVDSSTLATPNPLRHAKRRSYTTLRMPHGKHPHFVSEWDVVDVIASAFEQDAACAWNRGAPIRAADLWCVANDVERCGQFVGEQVWRGETIPAPPVVDFADLCVCFRCGSDR